MTLRAIPSGMDGAPAGTGNRLRRAFGKAKGGLRLPDIRLPAPNPPPEAGA